MKLTTKALIHNSGLDLWNHFYYNTPINHMYDEEGDSSMNDELAWFTEGMDWMKSELLDNEKWAYYDGDDKIIFTSYGRVGNIKKKQWRIIQYQGSVLTTVVKQGGISVSKIVRNEWGIDIDYDTLPDEVKKTINARSYLNQLQQRKDRKNGTKAG